MVSAFLRFLSLYLFIYSFFSLLSLFSCLYSPSPSLPKSPPRPSPPHRLSLFSFLLFFSLLYFALALALCELLHTLHMHTCTAVSDSWKRNFHRKHVYCCLQTRADHYSSETLTQNIGSVRIFYRFCF